MLCKPGFLFILAFSTTLYIDLFLCLIKNHIFLENAEQISLDNGETTVRLDLSVLKRRYHSIALRELLASHIKGNVLEHHPHWRHNIICFLQKSDDCYSIVLIHKMKLVVWDFGLEIAFWY